jgi:hypothetical protein
MEWTIHISDAALITATIAGPVLAVQAQKWLERDRAITDRRKRIFQVLMTTRATVLSPAHVEALNGVPVEFYGPRNPRLKAIADDWHAYLDHLNNKNIAMEVWGPRRVELLVNLLFGMSKFLKYDFSKSELEKDVYYPTGHADIESDQAIIRRGVAKLLGGEAIPMALKEFPVAAGALEGQEELRKALMQWLNGERAVKVEQR